MVASIHEKIQLNTLSLTPSRLESGMQGLATISTLMAVFITTYGCFSLAKDKNMVLWTYWMRASVGIINLKDPVTLAPAVCLLSHLSPTSTGVQLDGDEAQG
jgi:formate-dependent nitrite reductase membrane component NrfD